MFTYLTTQNNYLKEQLVGKSSSVYLKHRHFFKESTVKIPAQIAQNVNMQYIGFCVRFVLKYFTLGINILSIICHSAPRN